MSTPAATPTPPPAVAATTAVAKGDSKVLVAKGFVLAVILVAATATSYWKLGDDKIETIDRKSRTEEFYLTHSKALSWSSFIYALGFSVGVSFFVYRGALKRMRTKSFSDAEVKGFDTVFTIVQTIAFLGGILAACEFFKGFSHHSPPHHGYHGSSQLGRT